MKNELFFNIRFWNHFFGWDREESDSELNWNVYNLSICWPILREFSSNLYKVKNIYDHLVRNPKILSESSMSLKKTLSKTSNFFIFYTIISFRDRWTNHWNNLKLFFLILCLTSCWYKSWVNKLNSLVFSWRRCEQLSLTGEWTSRTPWSQKWTTRRMPSSYPSRTSGHKSAEKLASHSRQLICHALFKLNSS